MDWWSGLSGRAVPEFKPKDSQGAVYINDTQNKITNHSEKLCS
jgi:hypothetical protein